MHGRWSASGEPLPAVNYIDVVAGHSAGAWTLGGISGHAYLPRVARRLYHARDLGEPFDFLTWFEFAPEDALAFEALVRLLRAREEWTYVEREIDIRLVRG